MTDPDDLRWRRLVLLYLFVILAVIAVWSFHDMTKNRVQEAQDDLWEIEQKMISESIRKMQKSIDEAQRNAEKRLRELQEEERKNHK